MRLAESVIRVTCFETSALTRPALHISYLKIQVVASHFSLLHVSVWHPAPIFRIDCNFHPTVVLVCGSPLSLNGLIHTYHLYVGRVEFVLCIVSNPNMMTQNL